MSKGHILNLKAQSLDTAGTYVCVVTVPEIEGMETSSSLRVFVKSECNEQWVTYPVNSGMMEVNIIVSKQLDSRVSNSRL